MLPLAAGASALSSLTQEFEAFPQKQIDSNRLYCYFIHYCIKIICTQDDIFKLLFSSLFSLAKLNLVPKLTEEEKNKTQSSYFMDQRISQ